MKEMRRLQLGKRGQRGGGVYRRVSISGPVSHPIVSLVALIPYISRATAFCFHGNRLPLTAAAMIRGSTATRGARGKGGGKRRRSGEKEREDEWI